MSALVREVVNEYDYEGLELDWQRTPFCCEPPASGATVRMMTDWIAELRSIGGSGVVVTPVTYIFEEEPEAWKAVIGALNRGESAATDGNDN